MASTNKEDRVIHPAVRQYVVFRKARGLTAQDLAELTGINVNTIRGYESGRTGASLMNMTKLAIAVGCTGVGCEGYNQK